MNTAFTYDFEEKTDSSIEYIFLDILDHADDYLKKSIQSIIDNFSKAADALEIPFESVRKFDKKELESYYKSIRRLNAFFEKMHVRFQNKPYFCDPEHKNLFTAISKRINSIDITCF